MLLRSARELVQEADGQAILSSKSCDGTPMKVAMRSSRQLPSGKKVAVGGRSAHEFLVKNQFLRTRHPTKGWDTRVILAEPVSLEYGKGVNAILQASWKDWQGLRALGHKGCAVEHFVWDRAGITALERGVRQVHAKQATMVREDGLPAHLSADLLALTEFVVITPCAMHDAHNAFRWGFLSEVRNRELMRDVYVAIESIRNSMDLVNKHIGVLGGHEADTYARPLV